MDPHAAVLGVAELQTGRAAYAQRSPFQTDEARFCDLVRCIVYTLYDYAFPGP